MQNIKKALSNSQRIIKIPAVNVPIDKILTHYSRLREAKKQPEDCYNRRAMGFTEEMVNYNYVTTVTLYHRILFLSKKCALMKNRHNTSTYFDDVL